MDLKPVKTKDKSFVHFHAEVLLNRNFVDRVEYDTQQNYDFFSDTVKLGAHLGEIKRRFKKEFWFPSIDWLQDNPW